VYAQEKNGPGQIVSVQGNIANGYPELYMTVARRNEVFAGKAMPGTKVLHYAEFTILRAGNTRWTRAANPQTGVPQFQATSAAAAGAPAPAVTMMGRPVDPAAIALVPPALIKKHMCLPVARTGDTLVLAMTDPSNPFAIDEVREATGMRIQTVAVPAQELYPAIQQVLTAR
jgi:hypothetical protein